MAQNTGSGVFTLSSAIVKDASGNIVGTPDTITDTLAADAVTAVDFTAPTASGSYTVTLVSEKGGSFLSSSWVVP